MPEYQRDRGTAHARRALDVMDQEGEAATLAYVALHAEHPSGPLAPTSGKFFDDDSAVSYDAQDNQYYFSWRNPHGGSSRPRQQDTPPVWPPAPPGSQPMFKWPNSEGVRHELLMSLERAAAEAAGEAWRNEGNEPMLYDYQSHQLAPGLLQAVDQAVADFKESDLLFQLMDEACRSAAADALQALPDEQKQALRQRIQELHDDAG